MYLSITADLQSKLNDDIYSLCCHECDLVKFVMNVAEPSDGQTVRNLQKPLKTISA